MSISTKIEMSFNRISRLEDLDELAEILFPSNNNHQRTFLAIFIELKYAQGKFLPDLSFVCRKYGVSRRTLERVRAKMRRMGIIDHISRFNQRHGYREGWVFSSRFSKALEMLAERFRMLKMKDDEKQKGKDVFLLQHTQQVGFLAPQRRTRRRPGAQTPRPAEAQALAGRVLRK